MKAVKRLVRDGISVHARDGEGQTALHEVCAFCCCASVPSRGSPWYPTSVLNNPSCSRKASLRGRVEVVKYLLKHGARAGEQDAWGNTPGHLAAAGNHVSVLAALLDSKRPPDLNTRNAVGVTLAEAAEAAIGGAQTKAGTPGAQHTDSLPGQAAEQDGSRKPYRDEWTERLAAELSGGEDEG